MQFALPFCLTCAQLRGFPPEAGGRCFRLAGRDRFGRLARNFSSHVFVARQPALVCAQRKALSGRPSSDDSKDLSKIRAFSPLCLRNQAGDVRSFGFEGAPFVLWIRFLCSSAGTLDQGGNLFLELMQIQATQCNENRKLHPDLPLCPVTSPLVNQSLPNMTAPQRCQQRGPERTNKSFVVLVETGALSRIFRNYFFGPSHQTLCIRLAHDPC